MHGFDKSNLLPLNYFNLDIHNYVWRRYTITGKIKLMPDLGYAILKYYDKRKLHDLTSPDNATCRLAYQEYRAVPCCVECPGLLVGSVLGNAEVGRLSPDSDILWPRVRDNAR